MTGLRRRCGFMAGANQLRCRNCDSRLPLPRDAAEIEDWTFCPRCGGLQGRHIDCDKEATP